MERWNGERRAILERQSKRPASFDPQNPSARLLPGLLQSFVQCLQFKGLRFNRITSLPHIYDLNLVPKVHMSIHDGLNHQCSVCGHTSKSRDALRKHLAYRHLIGMSGPVRPRMPATKRIKRENGDGDHNPLSNSDEHFDGAEPSAPAELIPDENDVLPHSGGEDTGDHHSDPPPDESW